MGFGSFKGLATLKIRKTVIILFVVWIVLFVGMLAFLEAAQLRLYSMPNSHTIVSVAWAGYVVSSSFNEQKEVNSITASWVVPQLNTSGVNGYSSAWVGIGGLTDKTLIQIGTEQNLLNGEEYYHIWYELLPELSIRIPNFPIAPGHVITASITLLDNKTNTWNMLLIDGSTGQSFSKNVFYNSTRTSGEWIMERSWVNNQISNLPDFGSITFSQCQINLGDVSGVIANFSYSVVDMTNDGLDLLASTGPLDKGGADFKVDYLLSS